jgi:hypothetical protein
MEGCPRYSKEKGSCIIACPDCGGSAPGSDNVLTETDISRLIAVGSYGSWKEAKFNQAKLDSAGINSVILDAAAEGAKMPFSAEVHGFTLQVEENKIEAALRILLGPLSSTN